MQRTSRFPLRDRIRAADRFSPRNGNGFIPLVVFPTNEDDSVAKPNNQIEERELRRWAEAVSS